MNAHIHIPVKKALLMIIPALLLFSCLEDDDLPRVENITKGGKWTLKIGSSAEEVYSQLQELGQTERLYDVAVVHRKPYAKPEEVRYLLPFYNSITLQNTASGRIERVIFYLGQDKVTAIEAGGALPEQVFQWPLDVPEGLSILADDPLDVLYSRLLSIYQLPAYSNYQLSLPNKPLSKSFDPDMASYDEWHFSFTKEIGPAKNGRSTVNLYFKNGRLSKIHHEYNEGTVYI